MHRSTLIPLAGDGSIMVWFVAQSILSIDRITKSKNNIEIIISIIVLIFVDWAISTTETH